MCLYVLEGRAGKEHVWAGDARRVYGRKIRALGAEEGVKKMPLGERKKLRS